ncbi:MAG: tetratricopeptide repeat protein [Alphaproteobacteria bacterium]|nr:tetratricopeptide repeat protein [Alphaproteobacteria bacterium]
MSDFFKELEEDIREERILNFWHKYGNYIIGLAVAIVIATSAYVLWQYLKNKAQVRKHVSFFQAVELIKLGKKEEALKAFHDLAVEGGGYGKIAQLYEASLLPDPEALYTKISQENVADPALGKLPKILMAARALDKPEVLTPLEPLTAPNNAWAPLSLELLALADLKRGDSVSAAKLYIRILKETSLTPDETLRAGMMLSQIDIPPLLWEEANSTGVQQ